MLSSLKSSVLSQVKQCPDQMFVMKVMELHYSSTPLSWAPHLTWEMWTCLSNKSFLKNLEYMFSIFTPSRGTRRVCMFVMTVWALLGTSCLSDICFMHLVPIANGVAKQDHNIIIIIHVKFGKCIFSKGSSPVGFQEKWFYLSSSPLSHVLFKHLCCIIKLMFLTICYISHFWRKSDCS